VNIDDFYAPAPAVMPAPAVRAPAPVAQHTAVWPWIAGAIGVLALLIGLAVVLWPQTSSSAPDTSMARLFGQQTRTQLPQPVTRDDCSAAVKAFPKIAADVKARAAFVDGCMQG
jgi:hypothetical protein